MARSGGISSPAHCILELVSASKWNWFLSDQSQTKASNCHDFCTDRRRRIPSSRDPPLLGASDRTTIHSNFDFLCYSDISCHLDQFLVQGLSIKCARSITSTQFCTLAWFHLNSSASFILLAMLSAAETLPSPSYCPTLLLTNASAMRKNSLRR